MSKQSKQLPKIHTSMNFVFVPEVHAEAKNLLPSLTQPDEVMSVREIVERFVRGMDNVLIEQREALRREVSRPMEDREFDGLDMEKIQFMDLDQRMSLMREYQSRVQILKDQLSAPVKNIQGDARQGEPEPPTARPTKEAPTAKPAPKEKSD